MAAVPVTLELPPRQPTDDHPDEIAFVEDMEAVSEANKCSCAASDDNPY